METPQTLHGQLYLLAYDRTRHRFDLDRRWLLGFGLRAAMLTDLFLTGHLRDDDGIACRATASPPGDPLLCSVFNTVDVKWPKTWAWLVAAYKEQTPALVRDQLIKGGWLRSRRSWTLCVIPSARIGPDDEDIVISLADRAILALGAATTGRPVDPRHLALGLLGVLAELPTLPSHAENVTRATEVRDLTEFAAAPIVGLSKAVMSAYDETRGRSSGRYVSAGSGGCGGGCGGCGAGCGGGCGGCGG